MEHYLVIFLKFIASIVPTIDYDYTMAADIGGHKDCNELFLSCSKKKKKRDRPPPPLGFDFRARLSQAEWVPFAPKPGRKDLWRSGTRPGGPAQGRR